jgi:hypothetical protein
MTLVIAAFLLNLSYKINPEPLNKRMRAQCAATVLLLTLDKKIKVSGDFFVEGKRICTQK